jgi:hypothetical protein
VLGPQVGEERPCPQCGCNVVLLEICYSNEISPLKTISKKSVTVFRIFSVASRLPWSSGARLATHVKRMAVTTTEVVWHFLVMSQNGTSTVGCLRSFLFLLSKGKLRKQILRLPSALRFYPARLTTLQCLDVQSEERKGRRDWVILQTAGRVQSLWANQNVLIPWYMISLRIHSVVSPCLQYKYVQGCQSTGYNSGRNH